MVDKKPVPVEFDLTVAKSHDGMNEGATVHVIGTPDSRTNALWAAGYFTGPEGFTPAPIPLEVLAPAGEAAGGDAVRGE